MNEDYRSKALDHYGEECVACGTEEDILVHHVDRDRSNNALENLIPVCTGCHGKIHRGAEGYEFWTNLLRDDGMMEPTFGVSHTMNGRILQFAGQWGLNRSEAYSVVIEAGVEALESGEQIETDGREKPLGFDDCPWCDKPVEDADDARWHLKNCPDTVRKQ